MRRILIVSVLGACIACAQITPSMLKPTADLATGIRYDAVKIQANNALRDGKPALAIELAEPLSKSAPDDIDVWYTLAQAYRQSGKLDIAEKTTQWMLDLRPEFIGGLWETGLLREQFKDLPGAVDMLNDVYRRIPASKFEDRSRILTDIARIFDKQELKSDAALLRKEIERLKETAKSNAKASAVYYRP